MLDRLRTPFFVVALVLIALAVVVEAGSFLTLRQQTGVQDLGRPGLGIVSLSLLDGILLYTTMLMGIALLVPERIQGRVQGVVSLIFSILVVLAGFKLLVTVIQTVILMVSLLLAPIFGTIAYLAGFGDFSTDLARNTLRFLMTAKLVFTGCLVLAHQRFLENKGLVILIVTSLLATFVLGLLHAIVPGFLVSITDGIGAIVALVLALIWAVLLLLSSVIAVVKAIV